jgi:hypothetical protein
MKPTPDILRDVAHALLDSPNFGSMLILGASVYVKLPDGRIGRVIVSVPNKTYLKKHGVYEWATNYKEEA